MTLKKIILFLTLAFTVSTFAITPYNPKKSQLNRLDKNIASIQAELQQANIKKSELQQALAQTETNENNINQQLKITQNKLSEQTMKLHALQQQSIPLSNAKNQNRVLLKQQIRAAYLFSQEPYLKIALAPNDVTKTHRILMYYRYITAAQIKTMKNLQQSLIDCQKNQAAIAAQHQKLLALKQVQLQNQQVLQKIQAQRQQLISAISEHIQTKHQKLMALLHDKQALESTVARLNTQTEQAVFSHRSKVPNLPFAHLRGKLSWPTAGTIRHAFGTQIYQSQLKWDGVLISAPQGQAVHAVAAGRVIFAKWMSGYGLLLIVNQGNGYMTLYGRNQTLTKRVGDWVAANEVIGTVGKSGGFTRPGLYFSIRYNGNAVNPAMWC